MIADCAMLEGFHYRHFDCPLSRLSSSSIKLDRLIFRPSASIMHVSIEGIRCPASRVTMPVRPTPEIAESCFCDNPALSRASLKRVPRMRENCCGEGPATFRQYDLKKLPGMSVLGHPRPSWPVIPQNTPPHHHTMNNQILRDAYGNKIGEIETRSDGTQVIRDKYGNKLGEYDPRGNVTRDKYGNRVAGGNMLTSLLRP